MKLVGLSILVCVIFIMCNVSVNAQNQNGCTNGRRNGIFYTDCWADAQDDRQRLQDAIDLALGKLVFNEENYYISSTLNLHSFRILEGTGISPTTSYSTSKIHFTGSSGSIFKIGSNITEVVIRDLALVSDGLPTQNTVGILAEGNNSTGASHNFKFSNLRITGFNKGIHVKATDTDFGWQFDNVQLDHSSFEACMVGIEINALNSGWHMSSSNFIVPTDGTGIKVIRGGYISMNLLIGNGTQTINTPPTPPTVHSDTFIYIEQHSVMSIQNSVSEGFKKGLDINGAEKTFPIQLINNGITLNRVKNSTLISTGNLYGGFFAVAKPQIEGDSDVYSIGDRFCLPGSPYCNGSGFELVYGAQNDPKPTLQILANREESLEKPMMKVLSPHTNKVLLELGNYDAGSEHKYTIKRDGIGWLNFEGTQANPYRGFTFNGPVKLPNYLLADLPTGTVGSGSMVFCSNCQENTSPCQSGGSGALAVVINNQWRCK